ncbi:MAG TPA: JAB domain-containing protein [Saprospiraceae bacterium]|nr:JAB domain-containing protein [Saprospiraceae bacterium]HRK80219.1 JAB domain-containing protein [Saprospiraceae bacterium]
MKIDKVFENLESSDKVPRLTLKFEPSTISRVGLKDAEKIADFVRQTFDPGEMGLKEEMILIPLDSLMRPICWYRLATGGRDTVSVDANLILMVCIAVGADGLIIAHNHPDNVAIPSEEDIESAHTLRRKAHYLGLRYVDDIIITREDYYSLAENDLIWE